VPKPSLTHAPDLSDLPQRVPRNAEGQATLVLQATVTALQAAFHRASSIEELYAYLVTLDVRGLSAQDAYVLGRQIGAATAYYGEEYSFKNFASSVKWVYTLTFACRRRGIPNATPASKDSRSIRVDCCAQFTLKQLAKGFELSTDKEGAIIPHNEACRAAQPKVASKATLGSVRMLRATTPVQLKNEVITRLAAVIRNQGGVGRKHTRAEFLSAMQEAGVPVPDDNAFRAVYEEVLSRVWGNEARAPLTLEALRAQLESLGASFHINTIKTAMDDVEILDSVFFSLPEWKEKAGVIRFVAVDCTFKMFKDGDQKLWFALSATPDRVGRVLAAGIVTREDKATFVEAYRFLFQEYPNTDVDDVSFAMDEDQASISALYAACPHACIILCYFHKMENVKKNFAKKIGTRSTSSSAGAAAASATSSAAAAASATSSAAAAASATSSAADATMPSTAGAAALSSAGAVAPSTARASTRGPSSVATKDAAVDGDDDLDDDDDDAPPAGLFDGIEPIAVPDRIASVQPRTAPGAKAIMYWVRESEDRQTVLRKLAGVALHWPALAQYARGNLASRANNLGMHGRVYAATWELDGTSLLENMWGRLKEWAGTKQEMLVALVKIDAVVRKLVFNVEASHEAALAADLEMLRAETSKFMTEPSLMKVAQATLNDVGQAQLLRTLHSGMGKFEIVACEAYTDDLRSYFGDRCEGAHFNDLIRAYGRAANVTHELFLCLPRYGRVPSERVPNVSKGTQFLALFDDGAVLCTCRPFYARSLVCEHACGLFLDGRLALHPAAHLDEAYWRPEAIIMLEGEASHAALHVAMRGATTACKPLHEVRFRGPMRAWRQACRGGVAPAVLPSTGAGGAASSSSSSSSSAAPAAAAPMTAKAEQEARVKLARRLEARVKGDPALAKEWDEVMRAFEAEVLRRDVAAAGLPDVDGTKLASLRSTDRTTKRHKSAGSDYHRR